MTELTCRYAGDREQAIVSYLYEDTDSVERTAFEAHLSACARCRTELSALEGVRTSLGRWIPPEPAGLPGASSLRDATRRPWWQDIPAWAQVAAALLVLGVGAGIANLDVRYDANGLRVRTGWSPASAASPAGTASPPDAPWRAELAALEGRLRAEGRQTNQPTSPGTSVNAASPANSANPGNLVNPDLLRRVRSLVDDSERRQQRELALRLAEAMRDVSAQRQADLTRIDRSIGAMQNSTGLEILRTRETINNINNYIVRTSSQRPQ